MKLDLPTLGFILSLVCLIQVLAFLVQYGVNRTYRGIGWWLAGSACLGLGFILLSMVSVPRLQFLSMVGNPMMVAGRICILIGVLRFLGCRENRWLIGSLFGVVLVAYYYYLFGHVSIVARTITITGASAITSLTTAFYLFSAGKKGLPISSARFTGATFLLLILGYGIGLWQFPV